MGVEFAASGGRMGQDGAGMAVIGLASASTVVSVPRQDGFNRAAAGVSAGRKWSSSIRANALMHRGRELPLSFALGLKVAKPFRDEIVLRTAYFGEQPPTPRSQILRFAQVARAPTPLLCRVARSRR